MRRIENDNLILTKGESIGLLNAMSQPNEQVLKSRDDFLKNVLNLQTEVDEHGDVKVEVPFLEVPVFSGVMICSEAVTSQKLNLTTVLEVEPEVCYSRTSVEYNKLQVGTAYYSKKRDNAFYDGDINNHNVA